MAMFGKRTPRTSRRALRKAHTKTLVAQAWAEKQFNAKTTREADKMAAKTAPRAAARTAATRTAATRTAAAELSPKSSNRAKKVALRGKRKDAASKARSYVAVAKILAPVLAPLLYRAATVVRGQLDLRQARRIGVGVEQLGEFSGHGATLSARIAGLEPALAQMEATHLASADVEFRRSTTARLAELNVAVHAAERMPTPRRTSAHRSIAAELDRIDSEVLRKLGVR